jgi:hypothetical protein
MSWLWSDCGADALAKDLRRCWARCVQMLRAIHWWAQLRGLRKAMVVVVSLYSGRSDWFAEHSSTIQEQHQTAPSSNYCQVMLVRVHSAIHGWPRSVETALSPKAMDTIRVHSLIVFRKIRLVCGTQQHHTTTPSRTINQAIIAK